jgi:hypothetical protein
MEKRLIQLYIWNYVYISQLDALFILSLLK